ncbi:hypothetical protein GALMADRAFT_222151 [Galerina marginata CBS 339.88]|uniref:Uncharacterized protein n=1 Tax=Galerina marginata (strain CBS 339.88) TaxID=685588 RepID=A0A067TKX0_GALM3|nr:hypothetical protein GALMADRAFT_222151 [Galerina marginata CBS 339.88]
MYGTPARRHLNPTTLQRLLEEVQTTLRSVTEFFHGGGSEDRYCIEKLDSELPEAIERCKDEIESLRQEIKKMSRRLTELITKITQNHEGLDLELKQARTTTFPPHDVARSASVDLLAATIEASLIKLSLMKARSERTFYGHQSNQNEAQERCDVAQAISTSYTVLKEDEKHLKIESNSLDQQLQEYENLLRLVEGGSGGYQQVVKDWTKVKQETDECLKDLRRLGWTGD